MTHFIQSEMENRLEFAHSSFDNKTHLHDPPLNHQRHSSCPFVPPVTMHNNNNNNNNNIQRRQSHNRRQSASCWQPKEWRLLVMSIGLLIIVGGWPSLAVGHQEQEAAARRMMRPAWMQPKQSDQLQQQPSFAPTISDRQQVRATTPSPLMTFPLLLTKRKPTPTFDRVPESIEVWPGQTAILSCVVRNQGDRVVSWIRSSDLQILSSGRVAFTSDSRFTVDTVETDDEHVDQEERQLWTLTLHQARVTDEGLYECQLNTEPKSRANVTLVVKEHALSDTPSFTAGVVLIERSSSNSLEPLVVQEGATIRLVCRAHVPPAVDDAWAPSALGPLARWSLDGRPITSDTWRPSGVNVNTELSRIDGVEMVTTVLTLTRAEPIDSGSYGCEVRPLKDAGDRILVHVTAADGSNISALGIHQSAASPSSTSQLQFLNFLFLSGIWHYSLMVLRKYI